MRPTRPRINRALARAWRDDTTLQIGVDSRRARVVGGVTDEVRLVIDLLDGTRTREAIEHDAVAVGADPSIIDRVIDALACAGLLEDGTDDARLLGCLEADGEGRLGPELAALSLLPAPPRTPLATLARRRAAQVALVGDPRLATTISELLHAAGIGRALRYDTLGEVSADAGSRRRADLIVVGHVGITPWETVDALTRVGLPHLAVALRELTGVVGPLVLPGVTPCLRCVELHRRDRDPAWPAVSVQMARQPDHERPYPVGLAAVIAGTAALQVLDHVDGAEPATHGGSLELTLPDWRLRRRSWPAHADCGCGWREVG